MKSEYEPIIFPTDPEFDTVELYFAHDIHCGSLEADLAKWNRFKSEVLKEPNRFLILVGDYCENALVNTKGDIYESTMPPASQKEWLTDELYALRDRIVCIVPGNHESNRITKMCGLYPVYDCAVQVGIEDRYRNSFAFVDIGVGHRHTIKTFRQVRYVGFIAHRMKDIKACNGADFIDGIEFAAFGHDHEPKDHPRAKLVYNPVRKTVSLKSVEVLNSGSFLNYGGYAAQKGLRPMSDKCYKLILRDIENGSDNRKSISTVGFYV